MKKTHFTPLRYILLLLLLCGSQWVLADAVDDAMLAIRVRDYTRAVHLLYPAAKAGNKEAQYQLGILIRNGQGTRQNPKIAAQWLLLACKQGLAKAQYALGVMYLDGIGVDENDVKAKHWLVLAAKQGHRQAKAKLQRLGKVQDIDESTLDDKLLLASLRGDRGEIRDLLSAGANVNCHDELGNTPLLIAA